MNPATRHPSINDHRYRQETARKRPVPSGTEFLPFPPLMLSSARHGELEESSNQGPRVGNGSCHYDHLEHRVYSLENFCTVEGFVNVDALERLVNDSWHGKYF
jgi:hypothetical protein